MTAISNYAKDELLDHIFRNGAWATPGVQVWVGLYVTDPTDDDTGTEVAALFDYVRMQENTWDAPVDGITANTNAITWPPANGGDWGNIGFITVHDANVAGNLLWHGALDSIVAIDDGETFEIDAGDLDISLQ